MHGDKSTDVIGDWRGAEYDLSGRRCDFRLFIDVDGRYTRSVQHQDGEEQRDEGRWEYSPERRVLQFNSERPDLSDGWWVLNVTRCEDSNVVLVLRRAILASRNLPILFYRVHGEGRGYGSNWTENVPTI